MRRARLISISTTACTVRCGGGRKPDQSGQHVPRDPGASRRPYSTGFSLSDKGGALGPRARPSLSFDTDQLRCSVASQQSRGGNRVHAGRISRARAHIHYRFCITELDFPSTVRSGSQG